MRVIILYRPMSEHARLIEEYAHDFNHTHPTGSLQLVDVDSIEGSRTAALYDITQYPAVLALDTNGSLHQQWIGADRLPLMNDLAYYAAR